MTDTSTIQSRLINPKFEQKIPKTHTNENNPPNTPCRSISLNSGGTTVTCIELRQIYIFINMIWKHISKAQEYICGLFQQFYFGYANYKLKNGFLFDSQHLTRNYDYFQEWLE